jgi:ABC-type amino acid transport system permease subunit
MKKSLLIILTFLAQLSLLAQSRNNGIEMADTMRANGKIYIVVAVMLAIFAGLIMYLVRLDRKIAKLEKNNR